MGTDAFQEVDAFGATMAVVKHSFLVKRPDRLAAAMHLAFRIASSGRQGPVHVDLPKDVANADCPEGPLPECKPARGFDGRGVDEAARLVREARRPLVYAGGGIHHAGAGRAFRALVEKLRAPVVLTLKALGALASGHPLCLGMMGMHGTERANRALRECDLLLAVGARFDDRATGKLETFCPGAKVVHMDVDPAEVGKLRAPDASVVGCLRETLPALRETVEPGDYWEAPPPEPPQPWAFDSPCPRDVLQAVDADIVTTDVGQHQMWAAQFLRHGPSTQFLTSGGLGTMGFGLPAAIGAQLARPDARVACVSGDGSLMMMIHELATLRRYDLPVKIVLFDNRCLGMVRQWQELFFDNRESEIDLSDNPDFVRLAEVFGVPGRRVTANRDVPDAVEEAFDAGGPFLLHVEVERAANVWPLVPPGRANHEMLVGKP
jgi:acetolactate synthase-1/2/3 large subunit